MDSVIVGVVDLVTQLRMRTNLVDMEIGLH